MRLVRMTALLAVAIMVVAPTGAAAIGAPPAYPVSGTPIAGDDQQDPAAPLLRPGQYTDELARGESDSGPGTSRYYRVPTPPGAQVHVTAVLPMPLDRDDETGSIGVKVELLDLDGDSCASTTATEGLTSSNPDFAVASLSYAIDVEKDCGSRESLHLRVERIAEGLASTPLPVEISVRLEPAAQVDGLPEAVTDEFPALMIPVLGEPEPIVGGRSFTDAAALTSGRTYSDTLRTGEMLFYRVPMTWGQRLTYLVRDVGPTTPDPDIGESVSAAVHNPLRAPIGHALDQETMFRSSASMITSSTDYPVRYLNRENSGNSHNLSVAGDYFLVVSATPRDGADEAVGSTTIEFTVVISGEVDPAPTYLELGLPTSEPSSSGSVTSESLSSSSVSVSPEAIVSGTAADRRPAPATWWAAGGIVLVVAGVGVVLLRRRRSH